MQIKKLRLRPGEVNLLGTVALFNQQAPISLTYV